MGTCCLHRGMQVNNNKNFCLIALVILAFHTYRVWAQEPDVLVPFVANYAAYKWGDKVGGAKMALTRQSDGRYHLEYSSRVSKFFLSDKRSEHSIFTFENGIFTPLSYQYKRTGTGPDKSLGVVFQHGDVATFKVNEQPAQAWLGEFDNQLYRLQVRRWLSQGETSFTVHFVNYRGEKSLYDMSVEGKESLELPFGVLDTVKVTINRATAKRQTFMWFAPSLDFQLVRLQQFKDGDEQGDIRLVEYQSP